MENIIEVGFNDSEYPELLKEIYDPPEKLFCIGDISLLNSISVAIVGSRKCTEYGKNTSFRLGQKLTENGITVVSGMAKGIDAFAHQGALRGEGRTIAVMAGGADLCYPMENKKIRDDIVRTGLIISEAEPGYKAKPYDFPKRNRIISGLSKSIIIVEAAANSGSLITADLGLNQCRDVYAVPGNINSVQSLGTNRLIKEGAIPLVTINGFLEDLDIIPKVDKGLIRGLSGDEKKVYNSIRANSEIAYHELLNLTGFTASRINGVLTVLELKGLISIALGKIFIAK